MPITRALTRSPAIPNPTLRNAHPPVYPFQREKVEKGAMELIHIAAEEQAADGFTKPPPKTRFER
jgi:hypothetical protein